MRYSLLFFDDGPARATLGLGDWRALADAHHAFQKTLADGGVAVAHHEVFEPPEATTTVVFDGGSVTQLRTGLHVEARFVLGGCYVVEADDVEALLVLLRQAPLPRGSGFVEVRPTV